LNAVASDGSGNPGEILEDGSIAVGLGSVVITQLQPAGSKPMSWKDFCNGRSVNSGDQCGVQP
jgi:methionyl-tRNA formyltransferase